MKYPQVIRNQMEVRGLDIKEKLEAQLFKARERAQTANDTVRRLEEIVQHKCAKHNKYGD